MLAIIMIIPPIIFTIYKVINHTLTAVSTPSLSNVICWHEGRHSEPQNTSNESGHV